MPAHGAKPSKLPPNEVLSVITDTTRWKILQALDGDKTAKEVGDVVGIKAMLAQYHLKELAKVGLVDEFPLPGYARRFLYSRRSLQGVITITPKGLKAQVQFT